MVSRTALLFVALAGVTLCVTANADAGLESSAAFGSDALETIEGASGRSLLGKPNTPKKPASKPKYVVFQNQQNVAIIYNTNTQTVIGSGNIVTNYQENSGNTINQNNDRKLLSAKPTTKPAPKKYIVFPNVQKNEAVIFNANDQTVVGHANWVPNEQYNIGNDIHQNND